ncbi:Uncharacterised protein [Shigella sonnei]|nr:Uncharacterised protein [Shigella sonnei]CSF65584.1 Uncharacterised protein [Shigella sonnei]
MSIETFAFQGNKQAARRQFSGISGYSIKGDICTFQFTVENVGKLAKGYANHAITPSRRATVTRSE